MTPTHRRDRPIANEQPHPPLLFVPLDDQWLYDHPELWDTGLVPYHPDYSCYRSTQERLRRTPQP